MGEQVWKNCKIYHDGYNLSGKMNQVTLTNSADILDRTTYGSSGRKRIAGITNTEVSANGYWEAGSSKPDTVLFPGIGSSAAAVLTVCPTDGSQGARAYSHKAMLGEYVPGGNIGELMAFSFTAYGEGSILLRGTVMETGSKSTGDSPTGRSLGYRTTAQKLYAALHVMSVSSSGTIMDITVESCSSSGFTAASTVLAGPTTELAFTGITDTSPGTAQWASTQSSTANQFYRINWASSSTGANGSVNFVGVLGLQ